MISPGLLTALTLAGKLELVRTWRRRGELAFEAAARYAARGELARARLAELEGREWCAVAGIVEEELEGSISNRKETQ